MTSAKNVSPTQYLQIDADLKSQTKVIDTKKNVRVIAKEIEVDRSVDGMRSLRDILEHSLKTNRTKPCFGKRTDFQLEAEWTTYEQWVCTQHACATYGLVTVPLYDTLGQAALEHILKQTEMQIVICDTVARARQILSWSCHERLQHIVIMQASAEELAKLQTEMPRNIQLMGFEALLPSGPDDLCLLCYTSGSTGVPKGVMYTHRIFLNSLSSVKNMMKMIGGDEIEHVHLSYLPLSHIMEQLVMAISLLGGARVSFLTKTIFDLSRDLIYYRPTMLAVVPRILTRIHTDAMRSVRGSRIRSWFLDLAIKQKIKEQKNGVYHKHGLLDRLFFRQIREQVGGRVSHLVCGSAPLAGEVLNFARAAFSCILVEVYGSTETGGLACFTYPMDPFVQHAGAPAPGVKVKLVDVPSMDIEVNRDGMGEICISSATCTTGYFNEEEKTRELFDEDGFVKMGDIGRWTEVGTLKIVDRNKNIFKLAQGEYVAPEKVEQVYALSPLVTNVYVSGHSDQAFAVAVVIPDSQMVQREFAEQLAATQRTPREVLNPEELCANKLVTKLMLEHLTELGRSKGLQGFEQAKRIRLLSEPFSVANGLLTPTMKPARPQLKRHYDAVIDSLYRDWDV